MPYNDPFILEKQKDCLKLYLEHNGSDHDLIELEMRRLGWETFSRRILYNRNQRGKHVKGWIDTLGWKQLLVERFLEMGYERVESEPLTSRSEPPASAGGTKMNRELAGFHLPTKRSDKGRDTTRSPLNPGALPPAYAGGSDSEAGAKDTGTFHAWLKHVTPNYDWDAKHHKYICEQLAKVDSGEITRLMINVPPRHGKSELVTVRYAAWTLKNDPSKNVIIGSYGQSLANRFSRKIKRVLGDDWVLRKTSDSANSPPYQGGVAAASADGVVLGQGIEPCQFMENNATVTFTASSSFITSGCKAGSTDTSRRHAGGTVVAGEGSCVPVGGGEQDARPPVEECPFPFVTSRPKNTEAEWETSKGGGLRAVGVGAGVTGFGADLIIIDDPVKSRAEAESRAHREAVWDWFNDDLYTRLEPDGKIILIQTRWHEDDLAGRLLRQMHEGEGEEWTVVNLPAIALGIGSEPGAVATGLRNSPPYVDSSITLPRSANSNTSNSDELADPLPENHPVISPKRLMPPLLRKEGSFEDAASQLYKPKVIGFPRLYSRLNDWSASVPLANTGSSGVAAPGRENAEAEHSSRSLKATSESALGLNYGYRHHAGGTGVGMQDACAPVLHAGGTGVGKQDACVPVDQVDRKPGESLWPKRFPLEKLEQRRKQIGTYSFSSLYQQRPIPAEGGMFKREWFGRIISALPPGLRWIRGYDLGVTATENSDYTASFRVAFDREENMYIDGGFRRRMEFPEQRRYLLARLEAEANTEHCVESTHNGEALVQAIKKDRPGRFHLVRTLKVKDPKTARALEWINIAEQGCLFLIRGAWNEEFIDECCSFPLGTHDDQVDAVSLAVKARRCSNSKLHRF